eukprot:m.431390 g.431390  ORF g.431390 m.431390 type:complete len:333 (+) comp17296_c0_seq1:96-1094(+)
MYNHGHTDAWWQWRGMKRKGQDGQRLELGGFVALLRREKLPVRDAARGPGGHHHVAVGEEDGVVRVLVLLLSQKHRHIDHRDDLVGVVHHSDGAGQVRDDGNALLLGVHPDVARQRTLAHRAGHVNRLVPFKLSVRAGVVVEELKAVVGTVRHDDGVFNPGIVGAPVVCGEGAVRSINASLGRAASPRLVEVDTRLAVEGVHVVRAVAVAEVRVLGVGRRREPRRAVREGWVLAERAVAHPDDAAVEGGLCELLVVVGVVEELLGVAALALGRDLEAVRRARAEIGAAAGHELAAGAVRLPLDQAVLVLAVVLVREVNVVLGVRHKAVAVHK